MSRLRLLSLALAVSLSSALAGCPADEPVPVKAPKPPSEEDARDALEKAKKANDADALFEVQRKYPNFPSGKKAMHLGIRKLLEDAIDAAEKCDLPKAKGM